MPKTASKRPTADELCAAANNTVRDVLAPGLKVVFCGINPGLYTAWTGHHFARPGNRFWPALYAAGFTDRLLAPHEERDLLGYGCGVTNIVARPTATAAELSPDELIQGARQLEAKMQQFAPLWLAVLGISAYRTAFGRPDASLGPQAETVGGVPVWVLPNPSGLNAHYRPADLARLFRELRTEVEHEW